MVNAEENIGPRWTLCAARGDPVSFPAGGGVGYAELCNAAV